MTTTTDEETVTAARTARVAIEAARQDLRTAYGQVHAADDALAALSDSLSLLAPTHQDPIECHEHPARKSCNAT